MRAGKEGERGGERDEEGDIQTDFQTDVDMSEVETCIIVLQKPKVS